MRARFFTTTIHHDDGTEATLRYRKAIAILFFLAAERRPVPRTELLALLWPDTPEGTAKNALRIALADIRKELGPVLTSGHKSVAVHDETQLASDLEDFEVWARERAPSGLLLHVALDRPILEGLTFDDAPEFREWVERLRERITRTGIDAWTQVSDAALRDGNDAQAIDALDHALRIRAWDEPTQHRLIHLLISLGQIEQARQQLERCKRALQQHVNAEPSTALEGLERSIEAAEMHPRRGMPSALPSPFGLIGRTEDVIALERALTDTNQRLVILAGAPGIGKSTVAWAVARVVAPRFAGGVTTWSARNVTTKAAFRDAVRAHLPKPSGAACLMLVDDVPSLLWLNPVIPEIVSTHAHLSFLVTGTGRFDADLASVRILKALPISSRERGDTLDPATSLTLRAMEHAGSPATPTLSSDPRLRRAVRRTNGHPLSLIHLGTNVAERGLASLDATHHAPPTSLDVDHHVHVRSLENAFQPALHLLPREARETLASLAVFHGPFEATTARRVLQLDETRLTRDLQTLLRHHLISYMPAQGGVATIQLVGGLAALLRKNESGRVDDLRDAHAEWVSTLLEEAHDGALRHDQQHTFARIEPLLDDVDAAVDHLASQTRGEEALRLANHAWRFHDMAGRNELAAQRLATLISDFGSTCDSLLHSDALNALGSLELKLDHLDRARRAYDAALRLREAQNDTKRIASSLNNLAVIDGMTGNFMQAANRFRDVFERADANDEPWIAAAALVNLGHALTEAGDTDDALVAYQRGAGRMKAIGDQHGRLGALLGVIHTAATRQESAIATSAAVEWASLMKPPSTVRDATRLELPTQVTCEKLRTFGYPNLATKLEHALADQLAS